MMIILFALIVAVFALYVLAPFFIRSFRQKPLPAEAGDIENLYYRKDEVLSAIEDLKYDYQMKKISEADYLQLNEKLSREAVEVMKRIDQTKGADRNAKTGNPRGRQAADRVGS